MNVKSGLDPLHALNAVLKAFDPEIPVFHVVGETSFLFVSTPLPFFYSIRKPRVVQLRSRDTGVTAASVAVERDGHESTPGLFSPVLQLPSCGWSQSDRTGLLRVLALREE